MTVIVDKEFRTLIPPMREDEFSQLEANCLENGIQDSLKVWNGILIDGHNRYEIAQKHGLEFKVEEMEFSGRDDAKAWIIKNQLGRRNLNTWTRFDLVKSLEKIEKRKAKERMSDGGKGVEILPHLKEKTRDAMGEKVGVSGKTYDKMKAIDESDNEEVKQKVRNKKMSIDKAYREVKGLPPKKKSQPQTEVREVEITVVNEDVMKNPVQAEDKEVKFTKTEESHEEVPDPNKDSAETTDLDYAESVLGNILRIYYSVNDDGINRICNLDGESFDREHFKRRLSECIRILVRLENRLL